MELIADPLERRAVATSLLLACFAFGCVDNSGSLETGASRDAGEAGRDAAPTEEAGDEPGDDPTSGTETGSETSPDTGAVTSPDIGADAYADTGTDTGGDTDSDAGSAESNVCGDDAEVPADPDHVVDPSAGDTLAAAVDRASAGETILLEDGVDSSPGVMIRDAADLRIVVDEGATYVLDGRGYDPDQNSKGTLGIRADGVTVDGTPGQFVIRGSSTFGITVASSDGYTVRGVTVQNTAYDGIYLDSGSQNGLFERVKSYGADGFRIDRPGLTDGFVVWGGPPVPSNNTFRCVIAHHNTDDGIDAVQSSDTTVEYSLAWANGYNMDGELSPAPGTGFKLTYDESSYNNRDREIPTGNTLRKSLTFGNGGCGVMFGDGETATEAVTSFGNARKSGGDIDNPCRPGGNPGDIENWDADTGEVRDSLAEYISRSGGVTYQNNLEKPPSDWQMDTDLADDYSPANPATFGVPEAGSEIADRGVGAAEPDAAWVAEVLREAGQ